MNKLLLTLSLVIVVFSTFAQTAPEIKIKIGSELKNPSQITKMEQGTMFQVIVSGVNLNIYKVSINKTDSTVSGPISFPTFASLPIDELKKALADVTALGGILSVLPKALSKTVLDSTIDKTQEFKYQVKVLVWDQIKKGTPPAGVPKPTAKESAMLIMSSSLDQLTKSTHALQAKRNEIDATLLKFYKLYLSGQTFVSVFGTQPEASTLLDEVTAHQKMLSNLGMAITEGYEFYIKEIKPYQTAVDGDKDLKALHEKIKTTYTEFDSAIEKVRTPITSENCLKIWKTVMPVINNRSFNDTYTSAPLQLTNEKTYLNIEIKPWDDSARLSTYSTKLVFPVNNGKNFWGLSSGFYFGKGTNESYSTKTEIDQGPPLDTLYSVVQEDKSKGEIGFSTMLRYGTSLWEKQNVFIQFGFGPGVSISNKVRPSLLVGGGLGFGDKHKFLFDYGCVLGYYDVKSNVYDLNTKYQTPPATVVVSKLKISSYVSFSYLFYNK